MQDAKYFLALKKKVLRVVGCCFTVMYAYISSVSIFKLFLCRSEAFFTRNRSIDFGGLVRELFPAAGWGVLADFVPGHILTADRIGSFPGEFIHYVTSCDRFQSSFTRAVGGGGGRERL